MLCRFQTLYEIFSELNRAGSGVSSAAERGPVLLLLGGGMAAGKSTVREVIGHDDFWSKVSPGLSGQGSGCVLTMWLKSVPQWPHSGSIFALLCRRSWAVARHLGLALCKMSSAVTPSGAR